LTAVVYFYFTANDRRFVTDHSLFSSLLAQLCVQLGGIPDELKVLSSLNTKGQLPFELIFRAFADILRKFRQTFIVVDALDECSDARRLFACLRSMIDWDLDGLHLFLSGRPQVYFDAAFSALSHLYTINITASNSEDIQSLIHAELSQLDYCPPSAQENVQRCLAERAHGS
jgi:hypothetical protein